MNAMITAGTVLRGRYRVLAQVGQGGGGAVYRADDLRLPGRVTAVKEIRPDPHTTVAMHAQAQEQFRREASTLARLDHPALPKVSDYFVEHDADFLVMDFVDGPDLRQVVDDARASGTFLGESEVLGWLAQLLDVVCYLHDQDPPVLHRDIKPANIKRVAGDRIKLVDFGLVKPLDPADPRTLTVARGVGSLPYTPLEQYAGDTGCTDVRSDLYAVGATAYHLLTAQPPATAQERFLLPNALVRPRKLNPEVSPRTERAILSAMALHPDARPANANVLADILSGRVAMPQTGEMPPPSLLDEWRAELRTNAGLVALVGLLLLLAVLATWQAERSRADVAGAPLVSGQIVTSAGPTAPASSP
jgi:eukaryotic-like serine/threonine-protein kinase